MISLINLILMIIQIYSYLIIASAIMSWLVAFNVINNRNDFVRGVGNFLYQVTEPALRPIRGILPNLGGVDVSPIILLLILWFISSLIQEYGYRLVA
jgi:YggT family protein